MRHRAVAEKAGLPLASTTSHFTSLDDLVTTAAQHTSREELAEGHAQLGDGPADRAALAERVLDQLLGPESRDSRLDVAWATEARVGPSR